MLRSRRPVDPAKVRCQSQEPRVNAKGRWPVNDLFNRFTTGCARFTGRPAMLITCLLLAVIGVIAFVTDDDHFVNGANLAISVVTLLLLPILQASQNRDGAALQAKLDELINATADARNTLIGLERRGEDEIERLRTDGED